MRKALILLFIPIISFSCPTAFKNRISWYDPIEKLVSLSKSEVEKLDFLEVEYLVIRVAAEYKIASHHTALGYLTEAQINRFISQNYDRLLFPENEWILKEIFRLHGDKISEKNLSKVSNGWIKSL